MAAEAVDGIRFDRKDTNELKNQISYGPSYSCLAINSQISPRLVINSYCFSFSDSLAIVSQGAAGLHWSANCSRAPSFGLILLKLHLQQLLAQCVGCCGSR